MPACGGPAWPAAVPVGIVTALLLYTHYWAIYLIAAVGLVLLVAARRPGPPRTALLRRCRRRGALAAVGADVPVPVRSHGDAVGRARPPGLGGRRLRRRRFRSAADRAQRGDGRPGGARCLARRSPAPSTVVGTQSRGRAGPHPARRAGRGDVQRQRLRLALHVGRRSADDRPRRHRCVDAATGVVGDGAGAGRRRRAGPCRCGSGDGPDPIGGVRRTAARPGPLGRRARVLPGPARSGGVTPARTGRGRRRASDRVPAAT